MELIFRKAYTREFRKIKNKELLLSIGFVMRQIEKAKSISDIGGLKKLREYAHFYRIKIKLSEKLDYRLVLMIRGNKVWAQSVTSVKKIFYKQ